MRRSLTYILVVIVCTWACLSCSKLYTDSSRDGAIRLKVAVAETYVDTKAATAAVPYRGTTPTSENPLHAHVFFSAESGIYPHVPAAPTYLPAHTKVKFVDATFTYPDLVEGQNLMYLGNTPVYCVGLAPADDKWVVSDDHKIASHEIDGAVDLMYASQIIGTWINHFPVQEYRHALTWIEVAVCASDVFAKDFWGEIKTIMIESSSKMNIELGTGVLSYSDDKKTFTAFDGSYELKPTIHELGSVFCSPTSELTMTINSEKISNKTVKVKMPSQSITEMAGKVYVVELFFNSFDVVEGKCSIKPWEYQDENISMK